MNEILTQELSVDMNIEKIKHETQELDLQIEELKKEQLTKNTVTEQYSIEMKIKGKRPQY